MTEMVLLSACIMVPLDIRAQSALRQLGCHCSFTLALLLHAFDMGSSYRSFIYSRLGGCCTALHFSFSLVLHIYTFLISILSSLLFLYVFAILLPSIHNLGASNVHMVVLRDCTLFSLPPVLPHSIKRNFIIHF